MLLTVDIGNTNITLGLFQGDDLFFTARLATDRKKTHDQYAVEILNILHLYTVNPEEINGAIISSVVPELTEAMRLAIKTVTHCIPFLLTSDIGSGLKIVDNISGQLGADLAAVSVGAIEKYKLPCFIVDLGTANKIILIDKDGTFLGLTISAGVGISLEALSTKTSQLPAVSLKAPKSSIGRTTVDCMQSGTVFGTAAMIDGLTERMEKDFGKKVETIVATGGLAEEIVKNCNRKIIFDRNLILYGLKCIFEGNNNGNEQKKDK